MLPTLQAERSILVEKVSAASASPLPVGTTRGIQGRKTPCSKPATTRNSRPLKRVVGGQVVGSKVLVGGALIRNGTPVVETWRPGADALRPTAAGGAPGHLMVLGTTECSLDSHLWGPLPADT